MPGSVAKSPHRALLTDFLKTRRGQLQPSDVGLPADGKLNGRRTPGLRRSEVALLAGISTEWYTLFEMGRNRAMTMRVIGPVSDALRLTPIERDYVHDLVREAPPPEPSSEGLHPAIDYAVQHVQEAAAIVYDPWLTRLRWNDVARHVLFMGDDDWLGRNILWRSFKGSHLRKLMKGNWERRTRLNLGIFRRALARDPLNADAQAIVRELRDAPDFEPLWAAHEVFSFEMYSEDNANKPYIIDHAHYGELRMHVLLLGIPGWPGAHVRYITPADEHSVEVFRKAARGEPG